MKRIISLMLSLIIILSLVCVAAPNVSAASAMKTSDMGINMIKSFEGFIEYPKQDNGQWTVGYGTGVSGADLERYSANGITEEEAIALLRKYLESFEASVNTFIDDNDLTLSQNKFDALVSFTYNLGPSWMNESGTFRSAVISGATGNDFIFAMAQFGKSGGVILGSLVKRRLCEANLYLTGAYSTEPPANFKYVTYSSNLEGAIQTVSIQGYDTTKSASVKGTASKSGYRFLGWYTKAEGGEPVTTLGTKTASVSTLYGHWQNGDGEKNADGTIKGIATDYSGYIPANGDHKVYNAPGGTSSKTLKGDEKVNVVAEYVDASNVKWGNLKDGGWIKLNKGLAASPVYEEAGSVLANPVTVTVTTNNVNNRVGPGTNYASQGKFSEGQVLTLTAIQKGGNYNWGKSESGWIALQYTDYETVKLETSEDAKKVTAVGTIIKTNILNVRAGAGTNYAKVGTYNLGDEVKITLTKKVGKNTWGLTEKGWISLYYAKVTAVEAGSVPDIEPNIGGSGSTETPVVPDSGTAGGTNTIMYGTISGCNTLRIRSAPGTANKHIGNYAKGTKVTIYETAPVKNATWGRTDKGWISMHYVKLDQSISGDAVTGVVINCTKLNIRSAPGTQNAKVGTYAKGTRVVFLDYFKLGNVTWGQTSKGWISLHYVRMDVPIENLDNQTGTGTGSGTGSVPDVTEPEATEPEATEPSVTKYEVTIETATNGKVTASKLTAAKDTEITLTVSPKSGYELDKLIVKNAAGTVLSVTDNKFAMPASNVTVTATFKAQAAKYNVNINAASNGKVTASTTSCAAGTEVVLTVAPNAGYELDSLSVLNTATNASVAVTDGKFTMPAGNVNVVATFKAATATTYKVTVNAMTNGAVTANTTAAKEGDTVTLTVNPAAGYELKTLSVKNANNGVVTVSTSNTFTMPASNVTIAATFQAVKYNVEITASSKGSVSANPSNYAKGETVTLTVTPNAGYELDKLTVKDAAGGAVTVTNNKFTMPASKVTVTATFKEADYDVKIAASTNGAVTTSPESAKMDQTVTLTVKPATGYELDKLTVKDASGKEVTVTNYKFSMPGSDVTVTATFKLKEYNVVIETPTNGGVSVDFDTRTMGQTATLTVTPATGYELDKLTVKDADKKEIAVADGKFTMPASNVNVTATFKAIRTITVTAVDRDGKTVAGVTFNLRYEVAPDSFQTIATGTTNARGQVTFSTAALKNVAKDAVLDADPSGNFDYAWEAAIGDRTVRTVSVTRGLQAENRKTPTQGYLKVTANADEPISGSFTVEVVAKAAT